MTIKWKIDSIMSHDTMFGKKDVVYAINFRVIGPSNVVYGTAGVQYKPSVDFKPLSEITEQDCFRWVTQSLSIEAQNELQDRALQKVENNTTTSL